MPPEPIAVEERNGVMIVTLGSAFSNIDEKIVEDARAALLGAIADEKRKLVVVDLSNTTFFGSSFIEVLFQMWNRLKQRGGQLALCGLTSYCDEVVRITRLDQIWPICEDCSEAVSAVKEPVADA